MVFLKDLVLMGRIYFVLGLGGVFRFCCRVSFIPVGAGFRYWQKVSLNVKENPPILGSPIK